MAAQIATNAAPLLSTTNPSCSSPSASPSAPNTHRHLPIIDIAPFLLPSGPGSSQYTASLRALRSALPEHGFFYITNHGVSEAALTSVVEHARTFFQSAPQSEKTLLRRRDPGDGHGDGARGYQVIGENVTLGRRDWHEALDWYREIRAGEGAVAGAGELIIDTGESNTQTNGRNDASTDRSPPYALLQGINLWPSTPPTFRTLYESHISQMRRVGMAILHAIGRALDLCEPSTFADAAADSFWVMRAIGYPPLDAATDAAGGVSCGEHSDYGCLTLLLADDTPGALQVRDRRSGDWKNVDPVPDALVVNVGDMLELWTAGWVRSTKHRVVHRGSGFRVSVPFFLEPGRDVVVQPLPECVAMVERDGRLPLKGKVGYWDHLVGKVGGNFYAGGSG